MNIIFGLLLIVIGILNLTNPSGMVKWNHRWEFKKGAEPTEFAIGMAVFGGILSIIIGIVILFIPFR